MVRQYRTPKRRHHGPFPEPASLFCPSYERWTGFPNYREEFPARPQPLREVEPWLHYCPDKSFRFLANLIVDPDDIADSGNEASDPGNNREGGEKIDGELKHNLAVLKKFGLKAPCVLVFRNFG